MRHASLTFLLVALLASCSDGDSQRFTYSGSCSFAMYSYDADNNTYNKDSKQSVSDSMQVGIAIEEQHEGYSYIQVQLLRPIAVDTISVSEISFVTYAQDGKIDPDGSTYLDGGTCTLNGRSEADVPTACVEGFYTDSTLTLSNIYFQVGKWLFTGSFTGLVLTQ